jgi:carbon-monoxide dehydrogenase small subunit
VRFRLTVNALERDVDVEPRVTLAELVRDHLDLTGTHTGCEHGVCGACTVLLDGAPARACLVFAVQCEGRRVVTVEGFATRVAMHPLQQAWQDCHAFQCGFCTPGFLAAAYDLLADPPADLPADRAAPTEADVRAAPTEAAVRAAPTEADVREALSGNLCRCTGYQPIVDGVLLAAERLHGTPVPPPGCEAEA